ncbi:hypothetical protein GRI39_08160 [Altererythrobacter indicus]|uniref:Inner membrane protein n=1 Tax=Altericroceibacterium indicum TaxID=374177 RepID=A0A845A8J1_9SPHN|nr:hypothetical protein [Altericroceibacterium indicum]
MAPTVGLVVVTFITGAALASAAAWHYAPQWIDLREPAVKDVNPSPVPAGDQAPAAGPNPIFPPASESDDTRNAVEQFAQQQGGIDQRVTAMEQRLAKLDLQAQAASGNAARAEGLLIAFATRRAIERGAPLGYLADQLRLRFGDAHPNAVRAVIEASRHPVTLDQLIARLEGLAPELVEARSERNTLGWLQDQMKNLFVIRSEDTPSPAPLRRLARAKLFLESDRVDSAIAEVRNLPNAQQASGWIAAAERYSHAREALDLLEMTAILEPRKLRDSAGNAVEQLSPASIGPEDAN